MMVAGCTSTTSPKDPHTSSPGPLLLRLLRPSTSLRQTLFQAYLVPGAVVVVVGVVVVVTVVGCVGVVVGPTSAGEISIPQSRRSSECRVDQSLGTACAASSHSPVPAAVAGGTSSHCGKLVRLDIVSPTHRLDVRRGESGFQTRLSGSLLVAVVAVVVVVGLCLLLW